MLVDNTIPNAIEWTMFFNQIFLYIKQLSIYIIR